MMHDHYLEITFRRGKPLAAYLYLPRGEEDKSCRVVDEGHGMFVDLNEDGRPLGIEILSPKEATPALINEILAKYSLSPLNADEISPLATVG
jgi:hypothetical protein